MKLAFIGAGNLATNLAISFYKKGITVSQIFSRTLSSAKMLAEKVDAGFINDILHLNEDADMYFICVSDDAVESVLAQVTLPKSIIVHTAGSISMEVLSKVTQNYGVFYPLQTFSKSRVVDLADVPLCLEAANEATLKVLKELAKIISDRVVLLNSEQRLVLHIAAVFACNFTNHLYAISEQLLYEYGMDFEFLYPLIWETTLKIGKMSPAEGQTGPAIRRDMKIVTKHLKALSNHPSWKCIYENLTNSIINSNKGHDKH